MKPILKSATALLLSIAGITLSMPSRAGTSGFGLRLEPPSPGAGQPFVVVAEGDACERLFTADPGDGPYERVTVSPGLVQVQVGYFPDLLLPCRQVPSVVRVTVPGQPAGSYRVELNGRVLFTTDTGLLAAILASVVSGPTVQPPIRVPTLGLSTFVALGCLLVATAAHSASKLDVQSARKIASVDD